MIEAWVTAPDGTHIAHLDRSPSSPFRNFKVSCVRSQPGVGSLEYHLDNRLVRDTPGLFDMGNLVHMRYRDVTRVWIIEEDGVALDEEENATDWVIVSGRGALQLLADRIVFPPAFAAGNTNPATWATQWRLVDNRPAGEMLWDLIAESNGRFATQIQRGTVEVDDEGNDGITTALRFDNLLDDVANDATRIFGDIEMDGLVFNYYQEQGADRSTEIIFEEGADLEQLTSDRSERELATFVVGEGVGEGVFAKLWVEDDVAAPRRVERFFAGKDADNAALLQHQTSAAWREHQRVEQVGFEVLETRYRALVDYNLGDRVRVIAPSRGIDKIDRIDAIYLAEDGDRVRAAIDIAGLSEDELVGLGKRERRTASSLGTRNRHPQGQLVPINATGSGVFDQDDTMEVLLDVLDEVFIIVRAKVTIAFREFFAPATAASSGGGSTSGSSSASSSGASTASSSDSGGSSTPTSGSGDNIHGHAVLDYVDDSPPALTERHFVNASTGTQDFAIKAELGNLTAAPVSVSHTHQVTIGGHSHGIAHTHGIAHDHTTPDHTHGLTYGVFKEAMPAGHSSVLRISHWSGSSWDQIVVIPDLTNDVEKIDVTQYVTGPGLWRFSLDGTDGSPNGGRLGANVSVAVMGAIQSA